MGPFDDIGPYAGTIITTRKGDVADNPPRFCNLLISVLLLPITLLVLVFFGLFVWTHIGLIIVIGLISLGLWACARHGTGNKLVKWRWTCKLSDADKATIKRRLSGL